MSVLGLCSPKALRSVIRDTKITCFTNYTSQVGAVYKSSLLHLAHLFYSDQTQLSCSVRQQRQTQCLILDSNLYPKGKSWYIKKKALTQDSMWTYRRQRDEEAGQTQGSGLWEVSLSEPSHHRVLLRSRFSILWISFSVPHYRHLLLLSLFFVVLGADLRYSSH